MSLPPKDAREHKNYITPRGYKRLRDEHFYLRLAERPRVVEEVAYAASLGDRSENAEYIYGKKRLREIDRRLRFLGKRLNAAEVVDPATDRGATIYFGATVVVAWKDREQTFELVGEDEIEAELGRVSWRAPLGQSLMRKKEGDTVRFVHLGERVDLEILEVSYRPQVADPPTRWDLHQAELRARGQAVAPAELVIEHTGEDDDEAP
ncbi:MAG: GreA/GreB family elongation factor [Deltaproteobacteria bacterium]|nr:GreA/GreB family elongation factor [Deltaproteobacteria bacterium]